MATYIYWANVIATNVAAGNALAAVFGESSNDGQTFTTARPLYPPGTNIQPPPDPFSDPIADQPVAARFAGVAMKQTGYDMAVEFLSAGPYPLLNAKGLTDQQIASVKQYIIAEVGPRETYEARWLQFITDNGYVTP